jgi:hypothetical protein
MCNVETLLTSVGSEILTAVVMKSTSNILGYNALSQLATCFHAGILLALLFDPEYGGDLFF